MASCCSVFNNGRTAVSNASPPCALMRPDALPVPRSCLLFFKMADGCPHGAGRAGRGGTSFSPSPSLQPVVDPGTLSTEAQQELINGVGLTLVIIWMRALFPRLYVISPHICEMDAVSVISDKSRVISLDKLTELAS